MKENLKIKIPGRFKAELRRRFDLRRAKKGKEIWSIRTDCPLCLYYETCRGCPLARFEEDGKDVSSGCMDWVRKVLGKEPCFEIGFYGEVWWEHAHDEKAREGIKKLKRRAQRLIEWV